MVDKEKNKGDAKRGKSRLKLYLIILIIVVAVVVYLIVRYGFGSGSSTSSSFSLNAETTEAITSPDFTLDNTAYPADAMFVVSNFEGDEKWQGNESRDASGPRSAVHR